MAAKASHGAMMVTIARLYQISILLQTSIEGVPFNRLRDFNKGCYQHHATDFLMEELRSQLLKAIIYFCAYFISLCI